jgi:hypothetical protein
LRQIRDLSVYSGGHGLGEVDIAVDRVDSKDAGFAVCGGVELSDQPITVQDRQRKYRFAGAFGAQCHPDASHPRAARVRQCGALGPEKADERSPRGG